jgi:N-acetylmuramoyl-L-alanine amidase
MSKIKIAIDSGHGSNTAGKRTCALTKDLGEFKKGTQVHEHWINTYICSRLAKKLLSMGYDILKSAWNDNNGKDDIDEPLTTRQKAIKNSKCDYSVSIHLNASGNGVDYNSGQGTEVLIHNNPARVADSKNMANFILAEIIKGTKQVNRGVKPLELAMCNCVQTGCKASVLVECAFMTNLNEVNTMITQEEYWDETAEQIAIGIDKYIKSKTVTEKPKTVTKVVKAVKNVVNNATRKTGYVKIITETLNVRSKPSWDSIDVCGIVKKGEVFTVVKKLDEGFYLLKSGLYITTNTRYVEYFEK